MRTIAVANRKRAVIGLVLMAAQAFAYNAILFTYALVLRLLFRGSRNRRTVPFTPCIGQFLRTP